MCWLAHNYEPDRIVEMHTRSAVSSTKRTISDDERTRIAADVLVDNPSQIHQFARRTDNIHGNLLKPYAKFILTAEACKQLYPPKT